jgi:hypothetical protein
MKTTMNRPSHLLLAKTSVQKVSITLGIIFIIAGLGGIVMPGMLGMHLSFAHNIVHLASGVLAIWVGYSDEPKNAYTLSVTLGVVYTLLGIGGYFLGTQGYPGVGNMAADPNLLRLIPNVLEFGTMDHLFHILFGVSFIVSAYIWKKRQDVARG